MGFKCNYFALLALLALRRNRSSACPLLPAPVEWPHAPTNNGRPPKRVGMAPCLRQGAIGLIPSCCGSRAGYACRLPALAGCGVDRCREGWVIEAHREVGTIGLAEFLPRSTDVISAGGQDALVRCICAALVIRDDGYLGLKRQGPQCAGEAIVEGCKRADVGHGVSPFGFKVAPIASLL